MMGMIALIDYGRGNLASVANALNYLNAAFQVVSTPAALDACDALILPGVGAFDDAVKALRNNGLDESLRDFAAAGKPFLGICLGMQLLFDRSAEGKEQGLGLLAGEVLSFKEAFSATSRAKIPHMGWNQVFDSRDPLLQDGSELYFVHSYFVQPQSKAVTSAFCHYEIDFPAAIKHQNIRAYQFHPEKSGAVGLAILEGFVAELRESP